MRLLIHMPVTAAAPGSGDFPGFRGFPCSRRSARMNSRLAVRAGLFLPQRPEADIQIHIPLDSLDTACL